MEFAYRGSLKCTRSPDPLVDPDWEDELRATVEELVRRSTYDDQVQRYYPLASKKAILEAQKSAGDLEGSDEYQRLNKEFMQVRQQVDNTLADMDDNEFDVLYQDFATSD